MADIQVAVVPFALNTSTGNQTITHGTATFTPKVALFRMFQDTGRASGAFTGHYSACFGAADGTNEWVSADGAETAQARADTRRYFASDICLGLIDVTGNNTLLAEASFVSFGSGSVTINLSTADSTAWEGVVILIGGADLSVDVDVFEPSTTQDGTASPASAPGFQSDLILFSGQTLKDTPGSGTFNNDVNGFFGQCDGSLNQSAFGHSSEDNSADAVVSATAFNNRVGAEFTPSSRAVAASFEVTNISSTTFTLTTRGGTANTQDIGFVAMNLGGGDAWAGTVASLAGTGDKSWTDPGFQPIYFEQVMTEIATANSPQSGADGSVGSFCGSDGGDDWAGWYRDIDANATMACNSLISDDLEMRLQNNTVNRVATHSSFDSTGWTLNYSTNSGAASDIWPTWAIGVGSTAAAYSITGALTISASVAGAMIEGRTIAGAQQIDLAIAADMAEGREIAGAQQIDLAVAADMAFGINYEIAGAQQIDLAVAADMAEGRTIAGAQQIDLAIAADMAEGRAIAGAQQIDLAVAAGMIFAGGNEIAGDVTISTAIAAALAIGREIAGAQQIDLAVAADMLEGRAIAGAQQIDLAVAADMLEGRTIAGAQQIDLAIAADMAEGRAIAGAQQIDLAVAAGMIEGRTIDGAQQIDLAVGAVMAFAGGNQISGAVTIAAAVAGAMIEGRAIDGAQQIDLAVAAAMIEGRTIAGAQQIDLAVASGMAFGSGQEIAGALQIDLAVAAALAIGREIAGTQQILLLPAAAILEGRALAGASSVSLSIAADFQLAGILTPGDVTFTPAGPGFAASQSGPGFVPSIKP